MINSRFFIAFSLLLTLGLFAQLANAQQLGDYTKEEVKSYQSKAEDQVRFLSFMLNTLGSKSSSPRDKDVIIRESYKKIFRDGKVQVEDDLTSNRMVLVNKDITAYLKDIEFFFRDVKFDFEIKEIEPFLRDNGELSFKVTLNRTLKGTGLEGESILNTQKRFIEINLDKTTDELQIVSIYTTKVSREQALKEWWNNLSFGWKNIFKEKLGISSDSISMSELNKIASLDSINLAGNDFIVSVEPLNMLVDLQKINLSNTKIQDIAPLSSLTEITYLNLSNTSITDVSFLRYAEKLKILDLSFTQVRNLEDLVNLTQLEELYLKGTNISDFSVISDFKALKKLDLSETFFSELSLLFPLNNLTELHLARTNIRNVSDSLSPNTLQVLDLTFNAISDLSPLRKYSALKNLKISNTQVVSLEPLMTIKSLEKVYADNTFISREKAANFTDENPQVLIIINSEELSAWWASLNPAWKKAFDTYLSGTQNSIPEKEQLTKLLLTDSLNLDNSGLTDLFALKKFSRLRSLSIAGNNINSLDPLSSLNSLSELNASNVGFTKVDPLLNLKKLRKLNISNNELSEEQVLKLSRVKSLKLLNIDNAGIEKSTVKVFLKEIDNDCIVIYDTEGLSNWWEDLDLIWQQIFQLQLGMGNPPTAKELHQLTAMTNVVIIDEGITQLEPLDQFVQLESVYLERVRLTDLNSIEAVGEIKRLTIKETPIASIKPLAQLKTLEELNLDYSSVDDLRPLESLENLRRLSVAGTRIKNLKGLEELYGLEYLDISSTLVRRLKSVDELNNLEELKCYNTRIWSSRVRKFEKNHPECMVKFY
ncbi:leucine-rich repeat domain-containing protein [Marivirga sp. S37H4]|uniref:Leucine-rich repeat domain-containing protein n=1 Tax=Marivirga aurantiaca TaxID=2802615 RepID=A0A935C7B5_9BACT|nr:leucine-rich repeat domain-containing protein [Marivirga aurantiaca]MBK6264267.1 leucine-rich repeat domain-containing protein [Marivirga aurantiaca]